MGQTESCSKMDETKANGGSCVDVLDGRKNGSCLSAEELAMRYRMDHLKRGKFIIINNMKFPEESTLPFRRGSDIDAKKLETLFTKLGFDVEVKTDLDASQMLKIMIIESLKDHSNCDCFGVAVLSHGAEGKFYGSDGDTTNIDSFVAPVKNCKSLAGKPKLFFFQACRGDFFIDGVYATESDAMESDSGQGKTICIPMEADFLYAYSTVAGFFSWRNGNKGSWFIQALYDRLDELAFQDIDLVRILTRVNHMVAREFHSRHDDPSFNGKKQVPSVVSMLTKDLYFTRK